MTAPRPVYPGATYLITRRTTQRMFLLRPSPLTNNLFKYAVGVAAQKYGVIIHAIGVMSNHYHIVPTDVEGRLPDFERWMNSIIARALNASYGRWENLWAPEQPSNVRLVDEAAILEKTVYALTNPVAAGLVSHGEKWPGIRMFTPGVYRIRRPDVFFGEDSDLPEFVDLKIVVPPIGSSAHQAYRALLDAVAAKEAEIRAEFRSAGKTFLGAQRVLAQSPMAAPAKVAPRRELSPKIATRNRTQRIEALQRCKQFISDYRAALAAWKQKVKDVLFPYGTFFMVSRYAVEVAAPS